MKFEYVITPEMVYGSKLPTAPEGCDLEFHPPRKKEQYIDIPPCSGVCTAQWDWAHTSPRFVLVQKPAPPKPRRWIVEECIGGEGYGRLKYLGLPTASVNASGVEYREISCRVVEEIKS